MQASVQTSGMARSAPIVIDLANFNRGVGITVFVPATATVTYTVQYSGDAPGIPTTSMNWINSDQTNVVNATTSQITFLTMPMSYISLNVTAYSGSGNLILSVVQSDQYALGG